MRSRSFGRRPYRRWKRVYNPPILQAKDALFKKLMNARVGFALDVTGDTLHVTVGSNECAKRIREEILEGKDTFSQDNFRVEITVTGQPSK